MKCIETKRAALKTTPLGLDTSLRSYSTGAGLVLFPMLPQLLYAPGWQVSHL